MNDDYNYNHDHVPAAGHRAARIGITERDDAGLHCDWTGRFDNVDCAVLITKMKTKEKCYERT